MVWVSSGSRSSRTVFPSFEMKFIASFDLGLIVVSSTELCLSRVDQSRSFGDGRFMESGDCLMVCFFLIPFCKILRTISSVERGSPLHETRGALLDGLPGPLFVFSCLLHLARLF